MTPVEKLPPVDDNRGKFATGINDTGGKFFCLINKTGAYHIKAFEYPLNFFLW